MTDDTYNRLNTATNRAIDTGDVGRTDDTLKAYGLDPREVHRWVAGLRAEILDSVADCTVVDVEGRVVGASDPDLIGVLYALMLETGLVTGIELGRSEGRNSE
jgi:hypothetical protein